jgi:hypothetical protein
VSRDSSTSRLDAAVVAQIKANADLSAIGDNDVKIEASLLSKLCEMLLEPPYTVSESGLNQSHEQPIDIEERIRWHKSEARRLTLESIRGGQPSDIVVDASPSGDSHEAD